MRSPEKARGNAPGRPSGEKPPLTILLAGPRGFCAGVDRAILIVEKALERFGPPVYVRHEIVHNRFVVENLEAKGAVFVDEVEDAPTDRPIVFSAHGVPKHVPDEARRRNMIYVDATCPLVSKVHREVERHHANGRTVVLIGHAGHPEVEGTMGQLPDGAILLVEKPSDVATLEVAADTPLAYATQTTLSVDEAAASIAALKARFPEIAGPKQEDICYATTNRQKSTRAIAERADAVLVLGAPNSSNSNRLVDVARDQGVDNAHLIQRAHDIDWRGLAGVRTLGLTAGASAPEVLVEEVIEACRAHYDVTIEEVVTAVETIEFKLPRALVA
ncbi:4-hydroxy-3-methylbut-2-enyl diphosphate reductase [Marivibrio halodurans]|uniref:4-hydroxy-3-methylbut-2-enyl diphosphate reductase n=1 Tax=Marivibrio halodurans TaxID=2039722 RepID=A0A8J7V213_9PROT|nr:4-hydroxy-3-methylbut-2-enyl diphosphate reductase [Marivibrio halodurans]MBP5858361.1 4-hydroxy-3-methylbut-2-enyl diphosphate reductase [Marivibrio halodurans]